MIDDIKKKDIEIILSKSVSRYGRNNVDALEALKIIKNSGARIIFEQENLDINDSDSNLMISVIEAITQAENESRSENIRWGINQGIVEGTSKLYNKKYYVIITTKM